MFIDTKEAFDFSADFQQKATDNKGVVIVKVEGPLYGIVEKLPDPVADSDYADLIPYAVFKCCRDAQSFLAVRGWTYKDCVDITHQTRNNDEQNSN